MSAPSSVEPRRRGGVYVGGGRWAVIPLGTPRHPLSDREVEEAHRILDRAEREQREGGEATVSAVPRFSNAARAYAEHMCHVLNGLLCCEYAAVPEYVERLGYTGRVSLSPRAVDEIAARLIEPPPVRPGSSGSG